MICRYLYPTHDIKPRDIYNMHTGQELGMILLLFVVTVLMFSSLEFAFEREGEAEATVARPRDQVLYCTVL